MFFHWLLSLLGVAALAVYVIWPEFIMKYYNQLLSVLGEQKLRIIGIALLAVYAILAVAQAILIFKRYRRADRGFITVDSSDSGKVRIAIGAIEHMVRQSVTNIDGITEMKIGIENQDDAIGIGVNASIVNGSHVPTITMNMQRAIRQFVETNCGVAVRSVSITINNVVNQLDIPKRRRRGKAVEPVSPAAAVAAVTDDDDVVMDSDEFKPTVVTPVPAYQPPVAEEPEPVDEPAVEAEPEPVYETPVFAAPERKSEPEPEPVQEEPEPYDFDKPYESQFAKDLAAMKAKEAEQAEATAYDDLDDDE